MIKPKKVLKLFCVKDAQGKTMKEPHTGNTLYFDNKTQAKVFRDGLQPPKGLTMTVSRGPDNQKSGRGFPARYRLQPKTTKVSGEQQ